MLAYNNIGGLNTDYILPIVDILSPAPNSVIQMLEPVTFTADVKYNKTTPTWTFPDGSTKSGTTVTHTFGYVESNEITVTCSASNIYGTTSASIPLTLRRPMYVWQDVYGNYYSWMSKKFIVLREGIDGFASSTAEIVTESNCNDMGEFLKTRQWKRRDGFGFNLAIMGRNHAEIEANRRELMEMLSHYDGEGKLYISFDDGTFVYIKAEVSRGYPNIQDGLPPGYQARSQIAEIRFVSRDPFFYGGEITVNAVDGEVEIDNKSDVLTPCLIAINAETCSNITTGKSMTNNGTDTIIGIYVHSEDGCVTALRGGSGNHLYRFSRSSQFWMLRPGINQISGVAFVKYRPRWSAR